MKTVLITGASRGLGKEIKKELKKRNYFCISPTRNELNVGCEKSIEQYFKKLNVKIDILINNAGINILENIDSIKTESVEKMLNINLIAPLKLIQHVVKDMKSKKYGKIVNISSIWGISSKENRILYSMTKFGINGLTKSLAKELGEYNILVNSVAPGYINTEMTKKNVNTKEQKKIKKLIPLKRFAKPKEVAKLVCFLVSEDNSYMTGQTIVIDGGFLA